MAFSKSTSLRLYTSMVSGETPLVPTLEYGWLYLNIPDKKMWAVQLNSSTRILETTLILDPASMELSADELAAITAATTPSVTNPFVTEADVPFLSYTAFITQAGVAAPSVVVLKDDLGTPVWARTAVGTYTLTKTGAFTVNKTVPLDDVYTDQAGNLYKLNRTSADVMTLLTYAAADTTVLADAVLSSRFINIEVYK